MVMEMMVDVIMMCTRYTGFFFLWLEIGNMSPEGLDSWIFLQDLSIGLRGCQNTPQWWSMVKICHCHT
jgi:hypothetical protein